MTLVILLRKKTNRENTQKGEWDFYAVLFYLHKIYLMEIKDFTFSWLSCLPTDDLKFSLKREWRRKTRIAVCCSVNYAPPGHSLACISAPSGSSKLLYLWCGLAFRRLNIASRAPGNLWELWPKVYLLFSIKRPFEPVPLVLAYLELSE